MSFPRYSKYSDSGIPGLGELPAHWKKGRFGYLLDLLVDGTHHSPSSWPEGDFKYVTAKNIKEHGFDFSELTFVTTEDHEEIYSRCPVRKDDVLYIKDGATAGIAMVNPLKEPFSMLSSVAVLRPNRNVLMPRFVTYHLNAGRFRNDVLQRLVGGAMTRFTLDMISRFDFAIPPLDEQRAIATFLDTETSKIDALVAAQRRLIGLLKEKRQAVISHAVTKGLNPNAPLKPSGIPWLGDVPEHWEVGPIKRFFESLDGRRIPLSSEERSHRNGEYPYYGASGIIDRVDDFLFDEALVLVSEDGANLLNRSSPIAFVATGEYWVNNHAHILKPLDDNVHYWAERIEAVDLVPFVTRSAQPKFTADALMNLRIAVPPTETERAQIQQHVMLATESLNTLLAEAERAIELLQERRTALISAAVTGKIDVRECAATEVG